MIIKMLNGLLIVVAMFFSIRAGWGLLSGKPEMVALLEGWGVGREGRWCLAILTILGALLLVHPSTYVIGNYLMLAVILFLIVQYIHDRNYRGVLVEVPSFVLSLVIVYLSHPFSK